ncbi:F0F1 ATP synthase subunit A [bacterium]|nr:F0F1 ATP synthase subunit A [bacterium]
MVQISFHPEYVLKIGNFMISNTLVTTWVTMVILVIFAFFTTRKLKDVPKSKSLQNIFETVTEILLKFIDSITRSRELTKELFSLIATFFIFILTANLLGLIPGFLGAFVIKEGGKDIALFRSTNSDLNSTLALAIISVVSIQYFGIKRLGLKRYLKRFFNFTNPLKLIVGIFELISDLTKILSLSLRLFGNILAGEVLLLVMAFLVPYIIPLPFMILEVLVGFLQAFIFSALSLVFIKSAEIEY